MRPLAVVILAAGQGTRMKSDRAKVLHELCGRPMIAYPVDMALQLRPRKIVVVIGHQADQVCAAVARSFPKKHIEFALQETQQGTGHAVLQARRLLRGFDGDVLILYGDVPLLRPETIREFRRLHHRQGGKISLISTEMEDPTGYGRCLIDDDGELTAVVEEKDATAEQRRITEVNAGIYLVEAKLLWWALGRLGTDNAQGEMYLTDIVAQVRTKGEKVRACCAPDPFEVLGVNSRIELAQATENIRWRLVRALMRDGVTCLDATTFYPDFAVRVGADTVIEPNVMMLGSTRVGAGCCIGQGVRLENMIVEDNAQIGPYCVLADGTISRGAIVERFTRRLA
jgi:bifunctional UDP-N-acetylglucosamine pyrophosphorylase/glucosamine-1-phosphate N-acetyltransferase